MQIYQDGRHYDRMFFETDNDVPFLVKRANHTGGAVLELACGTGRIAVPLARTGLPVTGIDLSAGMLDAARDKVARESLDLELTQADMRDFSLGKRFSTIILAANALCHLYSPADFEACCSCVRAHLSDDGQFIVIVFVPDEHILSRNPDERFPFAKYLDPDSAETIVITHSNTYDRATQINHITTYTSQPGLAEVSNELTMRMYYPQELDALLKYNGLPVKEKYADFIEMPFGSGAEWQVIIAGKDK